MLLTLLLSGCRNTQESNYENNVYNMKTEAEFSQIIQTPFSAETAMTSQVIENEEGTAMNHLLIIVGK